MNTTWARPETFPGDYFRPLVGDGMREEREREREGGEVEGLMDGWIRRLRDISHFIARLLLVSAPI